MSAQERRASIYTLGCRLNQSETGLLAERLREAGYCIVPFDEPADLGIVHTCTVTGEADAKSRKAISGFIRRNPEAFVAAIGCYSQIGCASLSQIKGLDLIVGNREKLNLLDYVGESKNASPVIICEKPDREDFSIPVAQGMRLTTRANLKIQDGCDFMCSYCVIPFARGRARSRAFGNLLEEAESLAAAGAKEIVLTGVNLGTYAHEGHGIIDIVDALGALDGVARVRISSIEPTTIPEALFERMAAAEHALVPYLHIPMQSGSDAVLERMRRRYVADEFRVFIEGAANTVPDVCIGTDLLVGTPGETESEFAETAQFLQDSPIHYAHVFKYSERKNTLASRYPDKVDPKTASARAAELRRIAAAKRHAFDASHIGRCLAVLFEEQEGGLWAGYTGNYIRAAVRSEEELGNQIRLVRLERVQGDNVIGTLHGTAKQA